MQGTESLARMLYAILQYRLDLRYSRALHQLAAFILIVMGTKREEHAFWTLVALIQNKFYPSMGGQVRLQPYAR